ncbi:MAG: deoxyribonuclease V [Deltaproteobacteria bacterium]|nr:deoxyribonuclease V [Deltaproteobacteria bacterium]
MKIRSLHSWDLTYGEALSLQRLLAEKLVIGGDCTNIRRVAGADVSYARGSNLFYAAVVLLDYKTLETIEESTITEQVSFPYIPGLLSFREGPPLLAAFKKLRCEPDIALFDGQGIAHPRGIGIASHLGLLLDIPAIGCAKTRLVGNHRSVAGEAGAMEPLHFQERVVGMALRTKNNVKPLYVSPGHRIGVIEAARLTLSCCRGYRLPEPTRRAHILVNKIRRQFS